MATFIDLPNELKQEIINRLSPSVSLISLSSISRSWFQYLLNRRFTRIHLNPQNISRFLVLLQSPLCTFRQNVRHLDIHWTSMEIWRRDQDIIHAILTDPSTCVGVHSTQADRLKSFLTKAKASKTIKISTPSVEECQYLNIVCLFPRLEHLQVQLMGITSPIPNFPGQPPASSALESISVVCNSTPPTSLRQAKWVPPEWEHFLGWVRSNKIYTIQRLYLTCMAWWNYGAAETLIKWQKSSLKHLHLGPQALSAGVRPPHQTISLTVNLDSLHFEITHPDMSIIAADILSQIPSKNITAIGLDVIGKQMVGVPAELKNLEQLAQVLKTGRFTNLHHIHVRMEEEKTTYWFQEAARAIRGMFPENILTIESVPCEFEEESGTYEKTLIPRDVTDDCGKLLREGPSGGRLTELDPPVPRHQNYSISHYIFRPI